MALPAGPGSQYNSALSTLTTCGRCWPSESVWSQARTIRC